MGRDKNGYIETFELLFELNAIAVELICLAIRAVDAIFCWSFDAALQTFDAGESLHKPWTM